MPQRVFVDLELLPETAPFSGARLEALGSRGLLCASGLVPRAGFLNTDLLTLRGPQGRTTVPGRLARVAGKLYLQHDATTPFPIEDGAFGVVYAEHLIEHLELAQAVAWLREARRLLRPGGFVRLSTPDLALYVAGYADPAGRFFEEHGAALRAMGMRNPGSSRAWMMNQIFRFWGHRWLYDFEEVGRVAAAAGFAPDAVTRCAFQQGREPRIAALDQEERRDESLYVEIGRD